MKFKIRDRVRVIDTGLYGHVVSELPPWLSSSSPTATAPRSTRT